VFVADATRQRSHVQLEDPLLTALHQQLVIEGDFAGVEEKIREAAQAGLFDDYIAGGQYKYFCTLCGGRVVRPF